MRLLLLFLCVGRITVICKCLPPSARVTIGDAALSHGLMAAEGAAELAVSFWQQANKAMRNNRQQLPHIHTYVCMYVCRYLWGIGVLYIPQLPTCL